MAITKPTDLPGWCTTGTRVDPGGAKRLTGWVAPELPPDTYFNFIEGVHGDFLNWYNERLLDGVGAIDLVVQAPVDEAGDLTLDAANAVPGGTDEDGGTNFVRAGGATGDGGSNIEWWATLADQGAGTTGRARTKVGEATKGGVFEWLSHAARFFAKTGSGAAGGTFAGDGGGAGVAASSSSGTGLIATGVSGALGAGTSTYGVRGTAIAGDGLQGSSSSGGIGTSGTSSTGIGVKAESTGTTDASLVIVPQSLRPSAPTDGAIYTNSASGLLEHRDAFSTWKIIRTMQANEVAENVSGVTTETGFSTHTYDLRDIPAGRYIKYKFSFSVVTNTTSPLLRIRIGSTTIGSSTILTSFSSSGLVGGGLGVGGNMRLEGELVIRTVGGGGTVLLIEEKSIGTFTDAYSLSHFGRVAGLALDTTLGTFLYPTVATTNAGDSFDCEMSVVEF